MKAILLIRVSTEGQDLQQQTEKVKEEAIKDGFKEEDIIILEDKESAVKLSEEERNGLNNLKWHIKHDDIECVYAYELSRISRRPSILYSIRDFLIEHKIQLIILRPYMKMLNDDKTLSETANVFFGIFSSMAENEGYIRKARMRRGIEKKKSLGLHTGGPLAIGYITDKNDKIMIEPEGAKIVTRIFNEYKEGKSIRQLARELQAEGWRTKTSFLTVCQSILNILHREYYCGDKWHPQLVTRELFEECQRIAHNKLAYNKTNTDEALLKGIIRDMETGYLMSGNMSHQSRQYYCKRYGSTTISMKAADTLIGGLASEWYNEISSVKIEEIRQSIRNDIERQKSIIRQQEKNITDNQDKIDRIEERYIEGKISKEKAEQLEMKSFNEMQSFKRILQEAKEKVLKLEQELENSRPDVNSLRDKIKYVIESIFVKRISRFVCQIVVTNKFTGEERTYEMNTRLLKIVKMRIKRRPTLNYI